MKYKKQIKGYEVELSGSMIITRDSNGNAVKAFDTKPLYSVERFHEYCVRLAASLAKRDTSLFHRWG